MSKPGRSFQLLVGLGLIILQTLPAFNQSRHEHETGQDQSIRQARKEERERHRWMWQLPERVMNAIGVESEMTVADIGGGEGYFALRLSKRVGPRGRVYVNDIEEAALRKTAADAEEAGLRNLVPILGTTSDPKLPERKLDLALMVNTFHFLEDPVDFFRKIGDGLTPDGRFVVIQWDAEKMRPESSGWDAADAAKYDKELPVKAAREAGFELVRELDFLPVQSLQIFRLRKR